MSKRVLVVYYSQTGQLQNVLRSMMKPLEISSEFEVTWLGLQSTENFVFPWSFWKFFDAFPESVYGKPPSNKPFIIENKEDFDVVIIGYQPWFLSPSLPITAFMQSQEAKVVLKNKSVVTVIGCRNMWIEAHKDMKVLLQKCQATLIDNIVLRDQSGPLESFITTPRWMLTGKRDSFLGLSRAGILEKDIEACERFGEAIAQGLREDKENTHLPLCQNLGAVCVDPRFIASEKIGKRSFRIWGKLVLAFGKRGSWTRRPILAVYVLFLILLIVSVVPINMGLQMIIRRVFKGKMDKMIAQIEIPSGR
jgi:hypothetical protein